MALRKYDLFLIFSLYLLQTLPSSANQTWVRVGYYRKDSELFISDINSPLFTHLICAFVDIDPNTYNLIISDIYERKITIFTQIVKEKNPSIKTLLSIAPANSSLYSSMVTNSSSRKTFIDSSINIARSYGFNGLDLSWIYPKSESDMNNMGILLGEWRTALDSESKSSNYSRLTLTALVYYRPNLNSITYPVASIRKNLDWVHLISYYYHSPTLDPTYTGAIAALYDPPGVINTDFGIRSWIGEGMVANKIVMGLPYNGYAWTLADPVKNGIGAPATGPAVTDDGSVRYIDIKEFIRSKGAKEVYNESLVMNYCYSGATWIAFDDVKAIGDKVKYAINKGLLGYFVWHVGNDDKNWLLSQTAQANGTLISQGNGTLIPNNQDNSDKDQGKKISLVAILVPITVIIILLSFIIMCCLRRRMLRHKGTKKSLRKLRGDENNDLDLPMFSFSTIERATNDFSDGNKLGEGGFGPVYKGILKQQEIAVKRLSSTSGQGLEEFKNEVTLIAKLQHINLVRILGCCIEGPEMILIYEYMPNKSLNFYIFDPIKKVMLDWGKRAHIIEGIAQGLLYLHKYSRLTVIHRDLKASNILLDNEMNPKISDFGLARIFGPNEEQAITRRVVGTHGYMPPEYAGGGNFSKKSDVFSFGVLLLEILSGKKSTSVTGFDGSLNLPGYASTLWNDGRGMEFMDPILDDASSPCKLMKCLHVALLCVEEKAVDRPSMSKVVSMLNNETMNLPTAKKPAFIIIESENADTTTSSINNVTISELVARS